MRVLTLNAGSSSLKGAVYSVDHDETRLAAAEVDRIGLPHARMRITGANGEIASERDLESTSHASALSSVLEWFQSDTSLRRIDAVAHRVVHGGDFTDPQLIAPAVVEEIRRLVAVDPDHLPQTLDAFDTVARTFPDVPQVACFDTAFHRSMPQAARMVPLPARFRDAGVRRYGFHGLSCESIMQSLRAIDPAAAGGRLIIAHLGNGASMTAVSGGQSIDTTMGFSPAGGLMMGTRTGDVDPGVLLYALRENRMTPADLNRLVNRESGLLGVSGTSSDMHDLLESEATDPRSAAAIALFCHVAKKSLGALIAVLGGLDTLVFTGGIGEHAVPIRDRIVSGLGSFGIEIDPSRNAAGLAVISGSASRVVVRVMKTDEDRMLARHAREVLGAREPRS